MRGVCDLKVDLLAKVRAEAVNSQIQYSIVIEQKFLTKYQLQFTTRTEYLEDAMQLGNE